MSLSSRVVINTLAQIAAKIATVLITIFLTVLLTGYLGKEGYGNYTYIITMVTLFGSLADWGTLTIGVREISKDRENQAKILGNIFILRLIFSFLAIIFLLAFSFVVPLKTTNPDQLRRLIRIAAPIIMLVATKASFSIIFQSRLQMHKAALAEIMGSFLIFLFSFYCIRQNLGLGPLVWSVIWAGFFAAIAAGLMALKSLKFEFAIDKKMLKNIFQESLPMGAILLMFTMDKKIDTLMLGSFKGSGPVGIYALSNKIYDVLILGAAYLMNSMLPIISRYTDLKANKERLLKILKKTLLVLFALGFFGLLVIWFFSPLMIRVLTGSRFPDFFDSVFVLKILGLAMLIAYLNHLTGYAIVALGRQRPYFWIALFSLIFNFVANLIIIPQYSYLGAAWVTVLTEAMVLFISGGLLIKVLK